MQLRPSRLLLVGAVLVLGGLVIGCGASPQGGGTLVLREGERGIVVTGEGDAEARPDLARFGVGVEARRATVAEARDAAAAAQRAVLDALRASGLEGEDVQTTQLTLQPEYEYTDQGQRLLGYTARNTVRVRVRAIDRLSEIVDGAVRAGGDAVRLEGISFELEDPHALRARARERAMERARATAEQLARLAGLELGRALSIEEVASGGGPVPMHAMMEMRAADAATPTPIEPGTTRVDVQLRVRFETR
jgi:uncharacterized protein